MKLTAQQLQAAVTGCTLVNATKYVEGINDALSKYAINTPLRLAHFLAQIGHESIGLSATRESMNYTPEQLLKTFSRARISEADARRFGRIDGKQPANLSAIGNILYGGAWGLKNLGNSQPGDGYKFRGGGPMQTTGRSNYREAGKALGLDLETKPELLSEPKNYGLSAGVFWHSRQLNKVADLDTGVAKISETVVTMITKIVNGGSNGLADRQARLIHARAALGIPAPLKTPAAK